jgi:hypothetical protein
VAISESGIATEARRWSTNVDILGNRRPDARKDSVAEPGIDEDGFVVLVDECEGDVDLDVDAEVINLDLEVTARWQGLANAHLHNQYMTGVGRLAATNLKRNKWGKD